MVNLRFEIQLVNRIYKIERKNLRIIFPKNPDVLPFNIKEIYKTRY